MDPVAEKDKTPNEVYVKRYKDFIRLVRISNMLQNAKIIRQNNPTQKSKPIHEIAILSPAEHK